MNKKMNPVEGKIPAPPSPVPGNPPSIDEVKAVMGPHELRMLIVERMINGKIGDDEHPLLRP